MFKINSGHVYVFIAVVHVAACLWLSDIETAMLLAVSYILLAIIAK